MKVHGLSLARRFAGRFKSRPASDLEWLFQFLGSARELGIEFFGDRTLVSVELHYEDGAPPVVEAVHSRIDDGEWRDLDFMVVEAPAQNLRFIKIEVESGLRANQVRISLREDLLTNFHLVLTLLTGGDHDVQLLEKGGQAADRGRLGEAIQHYERYGDWYSMRNPFVNYQLAHWYASTGDLERAREAAVAANAVGNVEVCRHAYVAVEQATPPASIKEIRALQSEAAMWQVPGAPGAVVLDARREFDFEVADGVHLDIDYTLLEIRRPSAARLFSQTGYSFDASKESVLHAFCRIIHADDSMESIPDERVTIRDAQENNPLITLESKKNFGWILPELKAGDLIETSFHRLRRGIRVGEESWPGRITQICDPRFPAYRTHAFVSSPEEVKLRVRTLNCDAPIEPMVDRPRRPTVRIRVERHLPVKMTGLPHEAFLLEPGLAVGPMDAKWETLAQHVRESFRAADGDEPLPARLKEVLDQSPDPATALEKCFYLLRDDLKYAVTHTAKDRVGVSGRADQILESGVGDCSDKTYLLHLVCRDLGLRHDMVLVDSESGRMCEDVPTDVFDHVLLRVELDGRELWLDSSDRYGVFGSIPVPLQGVRGLVLDTVGTIVQVPEDDPQSNRLVFRERLDRFVDHRLAGEVEVEAHGTVGRVLDEHVKSVSLGFDGLGRGNTVALMANLPELSLETFEVHSHATHSRVFRVSGRHTRGRLSRLSSSGNAVARLGWLTSHLPYWEWADSDHSRKAWLGMPIVLRIELELGEAVRSALLDHSTIPSIDNELFCVGETSVVEDGCLKICREVTLRRGLVEGELIELVPALTEAVARASGLTLQFDGRVDEAAGAARS